MEKDTKIIFGVVGVLLLAIVSFNFFSGEITGEQIRRDTTPPLISNGQPQGLLPAGTTSVKLYVDTDEKSNCRYDKVSGSNFNLMKQFQYTNNLFHSSTLTGLVNGQIYDFYVKCRDKWGNINQQDYKISFKIDNIISTGSSTGSPSGGPSSSGFWAANGDHIYKTNKGDVGINTNQPNYRLTVQGRPNLNQEDSRGGLEASVGILNYENNLGSFLTLQSTTTSTIYLESHLNNNINDYYFWSINSNPFFGMLTLGGVRSGGTHPATIKLTPSTNDDGSDKVGIGLDYSAMPRTKLHVKGDVYIQDGKIIMPDSAGGCSACGPNNGVWTCNRISCP